MTDFRGNFQGNRRKSGADDFMRDGLAGAEKSGWFWKVLIVLLVLGIAVYKNWDFVLRKYQEFRGTGTPVQQKPSENGFPEIDPRSLVFEEEEEVDPWSGEETPAAPTLEGTEQATETAEAEPAPSQISDLAEAEKLVLETIADWSNVPQWKSWLQQGNLLRRLVKFLDEAANGLRPLDSLDFWRSQEKFQAERNSAGLWVVSEAAKLRYSLVVNIVTQLDMAEVGKLYLRIEPALQVAYEELGYQEGSVRTLLEGTCWQLLAVPDKLSDPTLIPSGGDGIYSWRDKKIEGLSDFQKLILRLGEKQTQALKAQTNALWDYIQRHGN